MLPALADEGLVDAVDVFCERIGFSLEQSERVFNAAARHKLPVKMHAGRSCRMAAAPRLAALHRALSADHLEFLDEAGVAMMKEAGTVAGEECCPARTTSFARRNCRRSICCGVMEVPISRISTDSNPGIVTRHVVAADDEHGDDAIPYDRARSAEGRDIERGARARQGGPSQVRSEAGALPTSRCGRSTRSRSSLTGSGVRCARGSCAGETVYAAPSRASRASSSFTRDAN